MGQLRPHAWGQSRLPGTGFRACPSSLAPPLPSQGLPCPAPSYLTFTGKVLDGHVLDGNLLEEEWLLAPGVPADDPPLPQPLAEPGQVAVAVEGVGQEVSARRDGPCLSGSLLLWERPQAPVLQRPRGPALRAGLLRGQRDGSGTRDADSLLKSGRSLCERERVPFQAASNGHDRGVLPRPAASSLSAELQLCEPPLAHQRSSHTWSLHTCTSSCLGRATPLSAWLAPSQPTVLSLRDPVKEVFPKPPI